MLGGLLGLTVTALAAGGQGALTQLPGTAGCVSGARDPGCARAANLTGSPRTIVVSADGRFVHAGAAAGTRIFRRGSSGRLTQLPGKAGCIENVGRGATPGCALVRGVRYAGGVTALSTDGRTAYAAAMANQGALLAPGVVGFERNPRAGTLTQFDGDPVCMASAREGKCVAESNLFALGALLSRDGRNVYLSLDGLVATFGRDPATGELTAPAVDATGCIREPIFLAVRGRHCATGNALRKLSSVVESPDGRFLYATSLEGGIAVLRRAPRDGTVTQANGRGGCVATAPAWPRECTPARGLRNAMAAAISPDGRTLYAVSTRPAVVRTPTSYTLSIFRRNPQTGALAQLPGRSGCLNNRGDSGCATARGLLTPNSVAVSPDGRNVYVASSYDLAVSAFSRSRSGALTQLAGTGGCATGATPVLLYHPTGCAKARMGSGRSVVVSPDGRHVYVGSEASYGTSGGGGQIGVFARSR